VTCPYTHKLLVIFPSWSGNKLSDRYNTTHIHLLQYVTLRLSPMPSSLVSGEFNNAEITTYVIWHCVVTYTPDATQRSLREPILPAVAG
jgi:hypothetical protein